MHISALQQNWAITHVMVPHEAINRDQTLFELRLVAETRIMLNCRHISITNVILKLSTRYARATSIRTSIRCGFYGVSRWFNLLWILLNCLRAATKFNWSINNNPAHRITRCLRSVRGILPSPAEWSRVESSAHNPLLYVRIEWMIYLLVWPYRKFS